MTTQVIRLTEVDSTNRFLREWESTDAADLTVAVAEHQTAGRGCGTNSWESEAGKNLLYSFLVRPTWVPASRQFVLSMACALAQKEAIDDLLNLSASLTPCPTNGDDTAIESQPLTHSEPRPLSRAPILLKWPNDIYWNDRKLAGTLIEVSVGQGGIKRCIMGTGINVNQQRFVSDAPNPVSICQITGHQADSEQLLANLTTRFGSYWQLLKEQRYDEISRRYHRALYRYQPQTPKLWPFEDIGGRFMASVMGVADDGHLLLRVGGETRSYGFKEVRFVI